MIISEEEQKEKGEEEEPLTKKDEEERRIAEMGRPMLGDHVKLEIIIEESYEFKVRGIVVFMERLETEELIVRIRSTVWLNFLCIGLFA